MSNNNRPEWAQGPEWDGWAWDHVRAERVTVAHDRIYIVVLVEDGIITEASCDRGRYVKPSTALAIANLIAEDRGGWA